MLDMTDGNLLFPFRPLLGLYDIIESFWVI